MSELEPRASRLVGALRESLQLQLDDMVVATEAGTGPFLYSPLIALMSGAACVIAVAPDSSYGSHDVIKARLRECATSWGGDAARLQVVRRREDIPDGIDIFLNLGFIRPLDRLLLGKASPRAVISYMCESWEIRPGDLDFAYCAERDLPVAGVHEDFNGAGVFTSCGQLALKLLFEAGIEVRGCNIGVLSADPFGVVIRDALLANGAQASLHKQAGELDDASLAAMDALVLASYCGEADILSAGGVTPARLARLNPALRVIQFAGSIDLDAFVAHGVSCHPGIALPPYRMSRTLAYLGERPVIALHALGLKVGELLFRKKNQDADYGRFASLVQEIGGPPCGF